MKDKRIEELIVKFISKAITEPELEELSDWFDQQENQQLFKDYIQVNYALDYNLSNFDSERAKLVLLDKIGGPDEASPGKIRKLRFYKYAVAAAIAILVSLAVFYSKEDLDPTTEIIANTEASILPGTDKAILTLDNGKHITLEKGKQVRIDEVTSNGESIRYKKGQKESEEIVYNYLTIPRGGQFFVELSDGTKVWLNSESKLKYPVSFVSGAPRSVELIYGEAYFDVSSSTENNGASFRVQTRNQNIEVLGTEFNISAYENDQSIHTTLIEGSIAVSNGAEDKILDPGMQSILYMDEAEIQVKNVDVNYVAAWKNGLFMFDKKPLGEMMKVLARWYNIEVEFENLEKRDLEFSGILKRGNEINVLLEKIEHTGLVKFSLQDNKILIK